MRNWAARALQWVLGAAVVGFALRQLQRNWTSVRQAQVALDPQWLPLLGALVMVWLGFAALIVAWRATATGGGAVPLPLREAARIWLLSSLGKYLPGKLWAMAGMMMLARRAGLPGSAAAGAAIFQQVVAIGVGAVLVFVSGREQLVDRLPGGRFAFGVLLAGAIVLLLLPRSAKVMQLAASLVAWRRRRSGASAADGATVRDQAERRGEAAATLGNSADEIGPETVEPVVLEPMPVGVLGVSIAANTAAWLAYGVATLLLAAGLFPTLAGELSFARALGGFTAAYLGGVLAVFAPGGIGVREGLLVLLLGPAIGEGGALVLAIAARILFTLAELGAAAPFIRGSKESVRVRT